MKKLSSLTPSASNGASLMYLDPKYQHILSQAEPYILSYPENWKHFNLSPWGLKIPERNRFSCLHQRNHQFYELLHDLDDLTFGPAGMPMEKWIFFDCAEMPGAIVGMAIPAKNLPEKILKRFKLSHNYEGLVPVSMYMAIPMLTPGHWFGHNLSSLNNILKLSSLHLPGLGLLTKAFALEVLQVKTLFGATQWNSKALNIHLQLGELEIVSAYTPAHTLKKTLCYRSHFTPHQILESLNGKPKKAIQWDQLIPSDEENFYIEMQTQIEEGVQYKLVGRPIKREGKTAYPSVRTN